MTTAPAPDPDPGVLAAWGWRADELGVISGGLLNATYAVRRDVAPIAVVQRLHKVFAAQVNLDLDAVTTHLAAKGFTTPRLLRTLDGQPWYAQPAPGGPEIWRALTWVDGTTVHRVPDPSWAEAGGELVGRFHRAVADLAHDYAFARAGVHDTAAHLARLSVYAAADADADPEVVPSADAAADARALAHEILAAAAVLPAMPVVPRRHCHGDLKISNLRFTTAPVRGHCLVDLDTLGLQTMAFELGDAMRSWCNPHGEDVGRITFDLAIFAAAMRGLRAGADELLSRDERTSIVIGLETVCLELAARFAVDVFRDDYFGWDPARFPSRRAHNLVRARGQLALGRAVRAARADALDLVHAGC